MQYVSQKAKSLLNTASDTLHHATAAQQDHGELSRTLSPRPRSGFAAKYMKPEVEDVEPNYSKLFNSFQLTKIQSLFSLMLDANGDGYLTKADMEMVARKLANNADWPQDSEDAVILRDSLRSILEVFLDTVNKNIHRGPGLTPQEFVNYFAKYSRGSASVNDFPYDVQMIPRLFFHAIGGGKPVLTQSDLGRFYRTFLPRDIDYSDQDLDAYTQRAFYAFTANGEIPLTSHVYGLVFSNFLLGRSPQTPGKYILPCFDVDGKVDAKLYYIKWQTDG